MTVETMAAVIQFDPERGEIRVGGAVFGCVAAPGGALVVNGTPVRPVTLGERDRLVALAVDGVQRTRRLARLVGDAATVSGGAVPSDVERAAIESVALHLAGAELPGALARTTLLVTRAAGGFGDAVTALPAADADRIAERLAAALPGSAGQTSTDGGGWTTISYDAAAPSEVPEGPAAAREHLAAMLLARDRPVAGELAAVLLGVAPATGDATIAAGGQAEPGAGAATAWTDRWTPESPPPRPDEPGAGRRARPAPDGGGTANAAALPDRGSDVARAGASHAASTHRRAEPARPLEPGGPEWDWGPSMAAAVPGGSWPLRLPPEPPPNPYAVADGPVAAASTRWTSPAPAATAARDGAVSVRCARDVSPALTSRRARAADPFGESFTGAPASDQAGTDGWPRPREAGRAVLDLDAIAIALHRAADLRGVH